ncbi:FAD-dependent oxidoreductase, partial [Acidobacteria bacterium AH-259-O06]|nr:FAD-dependent oxidoreductase [Acidobacteria bacterium AH-259-O06]
RARFEGSESLRLRDSEVSEIKFKNAIVATGSRPVGIPGVEIESDRVMDSTTALELEEVPETLLVVGGGYIGLELGTVYASLGSRLTLVELTDGLLPGVDRDLVRPLQKTIQDMFASIHLNTKVVGMKETKKGVQVDFEGEIEEDRQTFEKVLVSVGRRSNSDDLGLEKTRVEIDEKGFIKIDNQCRTTDNRIFAVGDVASEPMLAHKATREGKVTAEVIAGQPAVFDNLAIPAVVFTDPEVAWCGVTETQAKSEGREVKVTRFPWAASGRALTLGRLEGLTKMIFDPETGRILGVGIVGPHAEELIAEGVLAIEMGAVAEDLAAIIHTHPTLSETMGEVAEAFLGRALHIYRR